MRNLLRNKLPFEHCMLLARNKSSVRFTLLHVPTVGDLSKETTGLNYFVVLRHINVRLCDAFKLLTATHFLQALARLIGLLRRGGQLDAALRFLKLAEEKAGEGKAAMDAGYQYCKGLYEWLVALTYKTLYVVDLKPLKPLQPARVIVRYIFRQSILSQVLR